MGLGEVVAPKRFGRKPLLRIHDEGFLDFLETAWEDWVRVHGEKDALPMNWAVRSLPPEGAACHRREARILLPRCGDPHYAGHLESRDFAADTALTASGLIASGERAAFALTRPPGHHAARDLYGGYCFLNNAAIAAQSLLDGGAERVAILDIDYHHGNGTQSIFYDRGDVLFVSIHGDPVDEFPYFLGYADERGVGEGDGMNVNYPLPWGTEAPTWVSALEDGADRITSFGPDALVVSLGLDTYKEDPISRFLLSSDDYLEIGQRIAGSELPTVFVLEGGYAIEALGVNAVNVLLGFRPDPADRYRNCPGTALRPVVFRCLATDTVSSLAPIVRRTPDETSPSSNLVIALLFARASPDRVRPERIDRRRRSPRGRKQRRQQICVSAARPRLPRGSTAGPMATPRSSARDQARLVNSPNSPKIPADECNFETAEEEFIGPETVADGLGPIFNAAGCGECHSSNPAFDPDDFDQKADRCHQRDHGEAGRFLGRSHVPGACREAR